MTAAKDHLTSDGSTVGTIAYMSPEQVRGTDLDARTDLFSFGSVLYEAATGQLPFGERTTGLIFDSILNRDPVPPSRLNPQVPPAFEQIILKLLEKDRELRYQHASDTWRPTSDVRPSRSTQYGASTVCALPVTGSSGIPACGAKTRETKSHSCSGSAAAVAYAAAPPSGSAAHAHGSSTITLTIPPRKKIVLLSSVAALIVAVVGAWLALGHRAHALSDKDSIVIADFANTTGDQVFDGTLKQALAVGLGQSPYLSVVGEQQVASTLKRMDHKPDERLTSALAREICQRNGIKGFVAGTIGNVGSQYLITLQAINAASGETLAEGQAQASDKDHVLTALGSATSDLRGKLGESLASVKKFDKPLEDATTSSLEALKAYSLAGEKIDREGELQAKCAPEFTRVYVPSGRKFDDLCASMGLTCSHVCDWGGSSVRCDDDPYPDGGDGSRIAFCRP